MSVQDSTTIMGEGLSPVPEKIDIGQILIRDGVITVGQLHECLKVQAEFAAKPGTAIPRLGEILMQRGYATAEAVAQALGEQDKTILFCPRCNILLNIDRRPDAVGYACGRCQGPLQHPVPGQLPKSTESSVIVNSRMPVPPEVQAIREDPKRRFGKYVTLELLGRGGIAEVARAWDTYLHQYVALKRIRSLPPEESGERHSRIASLLNEAHNAIRLRHPNIVSVYDIGRIGGEYYISMEYLDGRTLYDEILHHWEKKKVSPYHEDPRKWLDVLFQVAHAVHYAHTRPVPTLHCDLKPGNIFVTREGRVCVLDFGLARGLGEFESETGVIVGTPSYMSPEQACGRNDEIDPRSDVYGLGTILYELLCGRAPFLGSMGEVIRRTVTEKPCPPSQVIRLKQGAGEAPKDLPPIPPALEALCMKCLEKKREARPPSALAFALSLEAIARGGTAETIASPPTPPPGPAAPRLSRRAAGVIAAALLLMALLGGWAAWRSGGAEESELRADLGRFLPEAALERGGAGGGDLAKEVEALRSFKARLAARVSDLKPSMTELALRGRRASNVKVWKVKPGNLVFTAGGEPDEVAWSELAPESVVALARACGLEAASQDRYALGLFCMHAKVSGAARGYFESLKGTEYEALSVKQLASLGVVR